MHDPYLVSGGSGGGDGSGGGPEVGEGGRGGEGAARVRGEHWSSTVVLRLVLASIVQIGLQGGGEARQVRHAQTHGEFDGPMESQMDPS